MKTVENYDLIRAKKYDEESDFDKGNRMQHCDVLKYILSYKESEVKNFLELGCGTGFYSAIFVERYPHMNGYLLDGSRDMLQVAKEKLGGKESLHFIPVLLEDILWGALPSMDIVYSALTIHHLTHIHKYELYNRIYEQLNVNGRFIYFDQFKVQDEDANLLNEYLACKDIQCRLMDKLGLGPDELLDEMDIERIIQNDRAVKSAENDQEDYLDSTLVQLKTAGFRLVTTIYQEFRFFGILAIK